MDTPPVNIHVSVTINTPTQNNSSAVVNQTNNSQTLSALKKARSMSRATNNSQASSSPLSTVGGATVGGVAAKGESPQRPHREVLVGDPMDVRRSYHGSTAEDFEKPRKSGSKHQQKAEFSAGTGFSGGVSSTAGTPKKKGCCVIM